MAFQHCKQADAEFGPQIRPECRSFDFTVLFEESIFSLTPSVIFLILATFRSCRIIFCRSIVRIESLYFAKLAFIALYAAAEIVQLVLGTKAYRLRTQITIASNVLTLVATCVVLLLSHLEHRKSFRPSSLLCTYLCFSFLLDIPRARTLWTYTNDRGVSITFTIALGLKLLVLVLESQKKTKILLSAASPYSVEEATNIFSRRFFWWLNGLFHRGYKKALLLPDLLVVDEDLTAERLSSKLLKTWSYCSPQPSRYVLAYCLANTFKWSLVAPVLPRLLYTGFLFAQPFLVQSTTKYLKYSRDAAPDSWGYGLIGAYALVYIGIAISSSWYRHKQYRFITMIRGGLVSLIYSKSLEMDISAAASSEATTLMSADVERIVSGLQNFHELWAAALDLGIGLWLLYRQVGLAMLSMAGLSLVCAFGASTIARYSVVRQKAWMEAMQGRIGDTVQMLGSLKSIKMLGFEKRLSTITQKLRQKEVDACIHFRIATTLVIVLAHANVTINPVIVFSSFLPISRDKNLLFTSERVFNTLALVALVTEPLQNLLQSLPQLTMGLGCVERIQTYLLCKNHEDPRTFESNSGPQKGSGSSECEGESTVNFPNAYNIQNGSFGWTPDTPILHNINLSIPTGKLTFVIGPVGSGKSTLLHALLGEVQQLEGQLSCVSRHVAFCSQKPWLTNLSVRDSIISHYEVDEDWYNKILKACNLDIDIMSLKQGDQTMIGSSGASLSGGQKQRLALARAVYARKSVLILDDIFSGLDKSTELAVFTALFGPSGLIRISSPNTTIILATHAVRLLKSADHIITLSANGTASEGLEANSISNENTESSAPETVNGVSEKEKSKNDHELEKDSSTSTSDKQDQASSIELELVSDKRTLAFYIKYMGFWNTAAFFVVGGIFVGVWKVSDYWALVWSEHNESHPIAPNNSFYIGIYALLNSVALVAAAIWFGHFLLVVIPRTGLTLHEHILTAVLRATYPFISRIDTGTLAARFGQDLLLVDTELPMAFVNTFFEGFLLIAQLALIASASVYMIASFPVLAVILFILQRIYLRTSRRIRHLDLEAKAPLYAQFTDVLSGIATIRAMGLEDAAILKNNAFLNDSQKPFYLMFCVQRWLECTLDLTVAGLSVVVLGVAVGTRSSSSGGAQIGVALLNLVTLGETLKWLVKFWTMLETSIAAVSRIRNFVQTTPQEQLASTGGNTDDWEKKRVSTEHRVGIHVQNVSASYGSSEPNVLSTFTLKIEAGEKIAVCGRTGSGKSSLLSLILKMIEPSIGSITLGDAPSSIFGSQELRQQVNTLPQDPYFFPGTIRENLALDSCSSDAEIGVCLAKVGLDSQVARLGGLDAKMSLEGFSVGQLQLLSLARAMLRPKGILLLDEATSSVDLETDQKMHDIIFEEFKEHTVVEVIHRREQLHRFDRIVVIKNGRISAVGKPSAINLDE